jgi:hypothetical protein
MGEVAITGVFKIVVGVGSGVLVVWGTAVWVKAKLWEETKITPSMSKPTSQTPTRV